MKTRLTPPVPTGFIPVGENTSTFIIRGGPDGKLSEFVWIPTEKLPRDGIMYGSEDTVAFGRRDFGKRAFYLESLTPELEKQVESCLRYGGFYLSRYDISEGPGHRPMSVPDAIPWTRVNLKEAQRIASSFLKTEEVSSHLPYAAEIDSMLCWLLKCGAITPEDAKNYVETARGGDTERSLARTGIGPERMGLYDLCRNVDAWVQESKDSALFRCFTCLFPQTSHCYYRPYSCYTFTGFRIALMLR